ncbi:flagellar m-ring protein flif [Lucifera butyrica]|uniref:Flagellar M-ring protein n=1 Tax=Lucifera butyrica TaxID=1351585 RepID=A0A498RAW3_9FIRM|nr:flagellar basal-body MS-ring/collar protein FliF [Lucifera butyrica]VBB08100.1 flagellar m-ring protein flif [Lucifera butyrica]
MADWKEQSLRLWHKLGTRERYIILGSAILVFIVILSWSFWWGGRPDMVPLYTNLEAQDAGQIVQKLKEMKVTNQVGPNGTILVSSNDVYRVRLDLAAQGLPRGDKGFEIFDQNKFGASDFQNKVDLLQALQGELTRTIEQMAEVEKARVHIVLPQDSLYKNNEKPATASIMLKLRPGVQLSRGQVKGIVNLVAHSIQGLKPENITVVDNYAHILNEQNDDPLMAGAGTMTQLEMTKKVQEDLQKNVQSLLDEVLGAGKAASRVNVELNFDQRTVNSQTFAPVVDTSGIVRSSQQTDETYKGSSAAPGGVPGTTSNIPGYVTQNNNNQSNYEKKEVTRNYEINETKEKVVATPGSIKRLTVAVLVDSGLTQAQQNSILRTVSSAIGLNPARGDTISVESISFNNQQADKQRQEELAYEQRQRQAMWLKYGLLALGVIAVMYGLWLFNRRRMRQADDELAAAAEIVEIPAVEHAKEKELSEQEKQRLLQRESIEKLAKSQPDDVAQLIKAWIADE